MRRLALSIIMLLVVSLGQASAAEIKLVASGALHDALSKALSNFETSSSHKLDVTWAGAAVYRPLLSSDKSFDAAIIASTDADTFIQSQTLRAPKVDLAKTGVGLGVRKRPTSTRYQYDRAG